MQKGTLLLVAILGVWAALFFDSCSGCGKQAPPPIDPQTGNYISAFTSGVISKTQYVRIRLVAPVADIEPNTPVGNDYFDFSPNIDGDAWWVDDQTIEFRPKEYLPSGKVFNGVFKLGKIRKDVPETLKEFEFQFQTIEQNMQVSFGQVETYESQVIEWLKLKGTISTADVMEPALIEPLLEAIQDGDRLKVTWTHDDNGRYHYFTVDSVERGQERSQVQLKWNGDAADIDSEGEELIAIPSLKDFVVMKYQVVQQPEQYVSIQFSDPLKGDQNLNGLLSLTGSSLRFSIDGNEIKAYPNSRMSGTHTLKVETGIKNVLGYKLLEPMAVELQFESLKPEVRLSGNGVILPNSNGLLFPFEAVSLNKVDVTIYKIFDNNIGQFLQTNQLNGNDDLKRVGRPILKRTIALAGKGINLHQWNTFYLDMNDMIKSEPGAIYKVEIGFRKSHSLYQCAGGEDVEELVEEDYDDSDLENLSNWDNPGYYYDYDYYYYDDYRYNQRENPCNSSYYGGRREVSRNILASDLGIIAKGGQNGEMLFAVTDMLTTDPLANVDINIYNYQNQLLSSAKTDAEGMVSVKLDNKPFLLVASKGGQRGYLRLDDGSSLSLSQFDISGQVVQKGIKGYIYGERGVWRPGDSLFLMFILEDEDRLLPANHPVVFELTDPSGQLVQRKVSTKGMNGMYNFSTATEASAPTGNWRAVVKVGGNVYSKVLKIETIKPNRLKLNLDFGKELIAAGDEDLSGKLSVKWLHGAIAKGLKAKVQVMLSQGTTTFEDYNGYRFDDPARRFYSEEEVVFDERVNADGEAQVKVDLETGTTAPGMLNANFTVRAFEEGGDFSIDRFTIPYAPYESFVGLKLPEGDYRGMLVTDTNHIVQIVTVDADGKPVNKKGLEVTLYKIDWRWWWEHGYENLSDYAGNRYTDRIDTATINTNNGKGSYTLRVNRPGWGRYLLRVCDPESGHCTGSTLYIDWPGWYSRQRDNNPGGAAMLVFSTDKEKYEVGETAKITFPSGGVGRALVTVESGSKVLSAKWVNVKKGMTEVPIKVTEDMSPNVYVHVTLVQPHAQTANDLPIRMYGVVPLMVDDPGTHLKPVISMDEVLKPEEKVTIKVSEANGKAMTYTVAVVDEGLLDLTRFKTPDPWSSFYAREALGVKTWDIYNYVMGAFGGQLKALLSLGGDGEIGGKPKNSVQRFKPVVKFIGPFTLKPGETQTHSYVMPNYVGSVRTMVVASQDGAYGSAENTTPVRKPLMVLATLPRVLGPGEKVQLPVNVFAMEDHVKDVTVEITVNDMLQTTTTKKTIHFDRTGDDIVNFELEVPEKLGVGKVSIVAKSGKEKASTSIELEVRNPNPPVVTYYDTVLAAGATWTMDYTPLGMSGTNSGKLEVSGMPPIDLGRRLQYLIRYPHGCIEQTTSGAFPQLYLADVMELNEQTKLAISDHIRFALDRLKSFQVSSGGLAYWPGNSEENSWGTNYAGHFMLEAEKKGYSLPVGMKDNWLRYQRNQARNWSASGSTYQYNYSVLEQAYRLYTLALAGSPELGAMNRLREKSNLSAEAKYRLAAAYALAGQPEVAKQLIEGANYNIDQRESGYYTYSYGSVTRDKAMILESMILMGDNTNAFKLLQDISNRLNGEYWLSTQTTAYCLMAAGKYAKAFAKSGSLTYSYSFNGGASKKLTSTLPVSQQDIGVKGTEKGKVTVTNNSAGVVYAKVVLTGIPSKGNETASSQNLRLSVKYTDMDGNSIDVTKLDQGTDFMAEVTITNPSSVSNYQDMALTQIFPSGWEIHNTRMDAYKNVHTASVPTYMDIRDDRVYTYFDLNKGSTKSFVVLLNAAYVGEYYLPTVSCEAMYDHTINARTAGKTVKVTKPGAL